MQQNDVGIYYIVNGIYKYLHLIYVMYMDLGLTLYHDSVSDRALSTFSYLYSILISF